MEQLLQLKQLYAGGFLSAEEYNARRIALVNQITGTSGAASSHSPTQSQAPTAGYPPPMATGALPPNVVVNQPQQAKVPSNVILTQPSTAARNPYAPQPAAVQQPQVSAVTVQPKQEPKRKAIPNGPKKDYVNWEFFHAAQANNVPRLKELLDQGVNINQQDTDTQNCALHYASMKGQKHALYYLVDRGADPNAQNARGQTCLHCCVTCRWTNLAIWLVQNGADIDIEDSRGFTPYDLALPWLQKELKDAQFTREKKEKEEEQLREARKLVQTAPQPVEEVYDDYYEDEYDDYENSEYYDDEGYDEGYDEGGRPQSMMREPSQYGGPQQMARDPSQYGGPQQMARDPSQYGRPNSQMVRDPSQYGRPNSQMLRQPSQHPQPQMMRDPSQYGRPNSQMLRQPSQRPQSQMARQPSQRPQSQMVRDPSQYGRPTSQMARQTSQRPQSQMARNSSVGGGSPLIQPPITIDREELEKKERLQKMESETVYSAPAAAKRAVQEEEITQEVMKVFLRNQAYKSLVITSVTKAGDVCSMMAEKLGLEKYAHEFDVVECVKGNEKRVDPGANIMRLKKEWPTILGSTGNETDKHCKLIVAPKRGSSSELQNHYRNAMYGK